VYCVVVQADRITTELPRPKMRVIWTYLDGGVATSTTLDIEVVTVTLKGNDGTAGAVAQVCTEGWDPLFLTGFASNNPPTAPNELDRMAASDWSSVPASPPTALGVRRDSKSGEWCVNLTAPAPLADIDVTLTFWAVYAANTELDDELVAETVQDIVNFVPGPPELKHIGSDGQVDIRRATNPNVIGSLHTACILPSVPTDTLLASGIQISSPSGIAAVGVSPFENNGSVGGVPVGTQCFTWTAVEPGRHDVFAQFTMSPANPASTSIVPVLTNVSWDTNLDGNDGLGPGGALVKYWDVIDYTVINTGGHYTENQVTNTSINLPVAFNVADGTFIADIDLTEWVIGSRPDPDGSDGELIDGVPATLKITSACGYFANSSDPKHLLIEPPSPPHEPVTLAGRIEFTIDTLNDTSCGQNSVITLEVRARYPDIIKNRQVPDLETLAIVLQFTPPQSAPIVAWAGTTVTLSYGFSGTCAEQDVFWNKDGGSGAFVPGGVDFATTRLIDCETSIQFESEVPGNIDITITLGGDQRSKVVIPIFYLAFEDLELSIRNEDPTVSEFTGMDARVRGWFVGDNPSGRKAETKPDGRVVPADRWVLPDDWSQLRGPDDFRPAWPATLQMPPAPVTFFMENEGVINNYRTGVKTGAVGWFDPARTGDNFAFDLNPVTGARSVQGTVNHPRIISSPTRADGVSDVEVFGDQNLSFEGCAVNLPTGNPLCELDDIAGRTSYYAIVDYPELRNRGKLVPLRSNNVEARFHWAGYKRVTWEAGATDGIRYVVAHLKDRDGFCDAINWNNTLGVLVEFAIDSDDGIITWRADEPSTVNNDVGDRHFALVTTFDTVDDTGEPMNGSIAKLVQTPDECQAWVRIDNSLGEPVNVQVTFSAPPPPIPGDIRITDLVCGIYGNSVTLTNFGTNEVSLAGWALRSAARSLAGGFIEEEHLGLQGHLAPGESVQISGETSKEPWIFTSGEFAFGADNDYAALRWNESLVDFQPCKGEHFHPDTVQLKADSEGIIVLDIIVPFNERSTTVLSSGWNLISIAGGDISVEEALGTNAPLVNAIFAYDDSTGTWERYVPGA
ncbi:MAG: hypothetical protein KC495_03180, partial [Dehalococcoidia bacterium]|nr:hypothetical protein [Dehalococcoidia bacterium]